MEIRALSGARAIPPLLIVLFHFSEGHHYSGVRWIDLLAARGYLWVEYFFALSGFILTHVYGPRLKLLFSKKGYGGFLRARLTRLYPLHLFMLLALLLLMEGSRLAAAWGGYHSIYDIKYHPDMRWSGFFLSLLLVHAWNTMTTLTWNGSSWFVSVEFALCLMFPVFVWLANGGIWRGFALIAAGVAGLFALDMTSLHGFGHYLPQWRAQGHGGFFRGRGHGGSLSGMAAARRPARMGA